MQEEVTCSTEFSGTATSQPHDILGSTAIFRNGGEPRPRNSTKNSALSPHKHTPLVLAGSITGESSIIGSAI